MNILLDNVNIFSTSGPNHFGSKLIKYLDRRGNKCMLPPQEGADIKLTFIESTQIIETTPMVLRLDGIYFDPEQNYKLRNGGIIQSYNKADGVVFQSEFNRDMCFKYFGEHKNYSVINNGADLEYMKDIRPLGHPKLDAFETVWCCAASWRRWKRLRENIKYFLEHSGPKDCLVIAGHVDASEAIIHDRIFFVGDINTNSLYSLYKRSKYMIHLARFDSCPNVVVDARAAGCQIICSSIAGTKEVAGPDAIVIHEKPWDYSPASTTNLPEISFDKVISNGYNTNIDMVDVSERYEQFLKETLNASTKTG
jgi:glycosyltransferase involved in cell wall biosynthesis